MNPPPKHKPRHPLQLGQLRSPPPSSPPEHALPWQPTWLSQAPTIRAPRGQAPAQRPCTQHRRQPACTQHRGHLCSAHPLLWAALAPPSLTEAPRGLAASWQTPSGVHARQPCGQARERSASGRSSSAKHRSWLRRCRGAKRRPSATRDATAQSESRRRLRQSRRRRSGVCLGLGQASGKRGASGVHACLVLLLLHPRAYADESPRAQRPSHALVGGRHLERQRGGGGCRRRQISWRRQRRRSVRRRWQMEQRRRLYRQERVRSRRVRNERRW